MAKLILRLYGRFAYAIPTTGGLRPNTEHKPASIVAIAPRFDKAHARDHLALMTIPRAHVIAGDTNVKPIHKIVTGGQQDQCEVWVWSLDGRNVSFKGVQQTATMKIDPSVGGSPVIPDLALLEMMRGCEPKLLPGTLTAQPDPSHPSQAVIHLCGDGIVHAPTGTTTIKFVTSADAQDGDPQNDTPIQFPPGRDYQIATPDLAEFSLTVDAESLTIALPLGDGETDDRITIRLAPGVTVTIGFSNICSELPRTLKDEPYDLEFSQYYRLLSPNPPDDILIPRDVLYDTPRLRGEIVDCDRIVEMYYNSADGMLHADENEIAAIRKKADKG